MIEKLIDPEFEVPPAKKARLDIGLLETIISSTSPDDSMEDLYDTPTRTSEDAAPKLEVTGNVTKSIDFPAMIKTPFALPGLAAPTGRIITSVTENSMSETTTEVMFRPPEIVDATLDDKSAKASDKLALNKWAGRKGNEVDTIKLDIDASPKNAMRSVPFEDASLLPEPTNKSTASTAKTNTQNQPNTIESLEPSCVKTANSTADETPDVVPAQPLTSVVGLESKSPVAKDPAALEAATAVERVSINKEDQLVIPNEPKTLLTSVLTKDKWAKFLPLATEDPDALAMLDVTFETKEVLPSLSGFSTSKIQKDLDVEITSHAGAEFEIDSSPIETSSSDVTSSSSTSDESDNDYQMLDPEEQARRLMQEDGGSDDESGKKGGNGLSNGPLRTLNEKPDEIVEKPNVAITTDTKVEELGNVEALVENIVLIKAKISGEYKVLETGSVLCLENMIVIGVVAETLGRVQQPMYSVRFTNATAIAESGIVKDTRIFYVEQHSTYVFTEILKAFKGSDASNIHDEEVADDEMEFSDDEAEAEYKRSKKIQKQSRRGGKGASSNETLRDPRLANSGARNLNDDARVDYDERAVINYEDISRDDEPYTPLARPSNLHELMSGQSAPTEARRPHLDQIRGGGRSRGRGDRNRPRTDGGRGDWGRGGDRDHRGGRERRNFQGRQDRGIQPSLSSSTSTNGHPLPGPMLPFTDMGPQERLTGYPSNFSQGTNYAPQLYRSQAYEQQPQTILPAGGNYPAQHHSHPQPPAHQFAGFGYVNSNQQYRMPPPSPSSNIPPGAFVNPAFFGNQHQQPSLQQQYTAPYPSQYQLPQPHNDLGNGQRQLQISPGSDAAFRAAQNRLNLLQQLSGNPGDR